jgi:hypothetical protein
MLDPGLLYSCILLFTCLPVPCWECAGADYALAAVLAATGAGALAAQLPMITRNRHAAAQAEADRKFYK